MSDSAKKVCVCVLYNCIISSGSAHRPVPDSGMRRIDADDLRAKHGSNWSSEICPDAQSGKCQNQSCNPFGKVTAVIEDCDFCSKKERCFWFCREEIY